VRYSYLALDQAPKYAAAGTLAGRGLGTINDFRTAEKTWLVQVPRRVVAVDNAFYVGVAVAMNQRGRPADEAAAYEKLMESSPQAAQTFLIPLAMAKATMRDLDGAVQLLEKALVRRSWDANLHRFLGDLQVMNGDLEAGIRTYRGGLALTRYNGWMNYHLGIALVESGKLEAGLDAIRRAPLAVRNDGLEEVKRWEHEVERLVELRPRSSGILSGGALPESEEEALDFARLCWYSGYEEVAVRYFERAFEQGDWLAGDLRAGNRYAAARAAIRAGRYPLALGWLREELAAWRQLLEDDPQEFAALDRRLHFRFSHPRTWFLDSALRPVRDTLGETAMPEEEQAAWKELWEEVRQLVRR
jgi:tetratricopeptide (TPR) repeat protein